MRRLRASARHGVASSQTPGPWQFEEGSARSTNRTMTFWTAIALATPSRPEPAARGGGHLDKDRQNAVSGLIVAHGGRMSALMGGRRQPRHTVGRKPLQTIAFQRKNTGRCASDSIAIGRRTVTHTRCPSESCRGRSGSRFEGATSVSRAGAVKHQLQRSFLARTSWGVR